VDPDSILLVDSDAICRSQLAAELRELGHRVSEAENASSAVRLVNDHPPDLMVLEWTLPDFNGVEFLQFVKRSEQLRALRVLMLSQRPAATDAVRALESGADDFVPKPFDLDELVARIRACLRRPASAGPSGQIRAGDILADHASHRVTVGDQPLALAPREYCLLTFLLSHQDRVYNRRQLLVHVWDQDSKVGERTVDVHIRRLRRVLEPFGMADHIQTVRGSGYRFSMKPD
jgi:two-component system, OmpR family, phosphate regulon response regulator PhoB